MSNVRLDIDGPVAFHYQASPLEQDLGLPS